MYYTIRGTTFQVNSDTWTSKGDIMVGEGLVFSDKHITFCNSIQVQFKLFKFPVLRRNRNFDFTPGAGLIAAGTVKPFSKDVERSTDRGQSFYRLPDLPYGHDQGHSALCVAIIDDNTVFIAGGYARKTRRKFLQPALTQMDIFQREKHTMIPISWT